MCGTHSGSSQEDCGQQMNVHNEWLCKKSMIYICLLIVDLPFILLLSLLPSTKCLELSPFFLSLWFCSLKYNMIRDEGACALAEALQVNQSLQELEWVQPFMSYFLGDGHWTRYILFRNVRETLLTLANINVLELWYWSWSYTNYSGSYISAD